MLVAVILSASLFVFYYTRTYPDQLYEITVKDPLFYSPAVNAERLRASIEALEKREREYKSAWSVKQIQSAALPNNNFWQNSPKIKEVNRYFEEVVSGRNFTFLHPLEFLKQIPSVMENTDVFLKNKDAGSAVKLLESYEKAVNAYKKSAGEQREILENLAKLQPAAEQTYYFGLAAPTNIDILLKDFRLIEKNAMALEKEVENRKQCFRRGACFFPASADNGAISREDVSAVKDSAAAAEGDKIKLIPEYLLEANGENSKKFGPYFIKTVCFGNDDDNFNPQRYLYLFITEQGNFMPKLATENFYFDLSRDNTLYGKKLMESGLSFDFQPDGADYLCTNLGYWFDLSLVTAGDKLAYLPEMVNTVISGLKVLITGNKLITFPLPSVYLIAFHSDYSLFYFPSVRGFWIIKDQPQYYMERTARINNYYKTYTELKSNMSDEEIKTFHFNSTAKREEIIQEMK